MSTGYSWEGIRQVRATLLGVRHLTERLCGGRVYLGRASSARPLPLPLLAQISFTLSISTVQPLEIERPNLAGSLNMPR